MFTGIIECAGKVVKITRDKGNLIFEIQSALSSELKIDQSLSHNGICLTVTNIEGNIHTVCAIAETISLTNCGIWKIGDKVNLERCTQLGHRLDGHLVQGHVDGIGTCTKIEDLQGSWKFWFSFENLKNVTVTKGSICINGVSLTVVDSLPGEFSVAIIPYTYENTNFGSFKIGGQVNLEFDIIGKYVERLLKGY